MTESEEYYKNLAIYWDKKASLYKAIAFFGWGLVIVFILVCLLKLFVGDK